MKFIVDGDPVKEPLVKLSLVEEGGCVVLKANGVSIMGFAEGKYCLFSDASGLLIDKKVEGLVLCDKFIAKYDGVF